MENIKNELSLEVTSLTDSDGKPVVVFDETDKKYKRITKYADVCSLVPNTIEEKLELAKVIMGTHNKIVQMKQAVGKEFEIQAFATKPYDTVDENTGSVSYGVTTTLWTTDGDILVTASKSVYHTLRQLFSVFGTPGSADYPNLKFIVAEEYKKGGTNKSIDLHLV